MTPFATPAPRLVRPEPRIDAFKTTGTSPSSARRGRAPLPSPFDLTSGRPIVGGSVGFEVVGRAPAPAVVVLGGISASRHVTSSILDSSPGWWEACVGPGRAIDTERVRVVGIDVLGGPGASSRPPVDPAGRIPALSTHDQARGLAAVLDALSVGRVEAIVGSSYGGMVGLAFAAAFPDRVARLVCISAAHRPHPLATALRSVQRRIVSLGVATGRPEAALSIARGLAMTTYRTPSEFENRFDSGPSLQAEGVRFPVEEYLEHCGRRFLTAFDPDAFLVLSLSLDLHQVDPSTVSVPTTVVSVDSDTLVPPWQSAELAKRLGGPARWVQLSSRFGHDAFLKETEAVSRVLTEALRTDGGET